MRRSPLAFFCDVLAFRRCAAFSCGRLLTKVQITDFHSSRSLRCPSCSPDRGESSFFLLLRLGAVLRPHFHLRPCYG